MKFAERRYRDDERYQCQYHGPHHGLSPVIAARLIDESSIHPGRDNQRFYGLISNESSRKGNLFVSKQRNSSLRCTVSCALRGLLSLPLMRGRIP